MKKLKLALTVALPVVGGMVSGYLANQMNSEKEQTQQQYQKMKQPPFSPPPAVFPIVWPVLYTMMGTAHYRIKETSNSERAEKLYYSQLVTNFSWSYIYFGKQEKTAGLVDILLLTSLVGATTVEFYKKDKVAGRLMLPYLAWSVFATYLNAGTVVLNKK